MIYSCCFFSLYGRITKEDTESARAHTPRANRMVLLSANTTLTPSNLFFSYIQPKPRLYPSSSSPSLHSNPNSHNPPAISASFSASCAATSAPNLHLQHKDHTSSSTPCSDWGDFAARVSGEWDGFGAEFSAEGQPVELPENVVPEAFREWGVQVFDWQTQCPTLASESQETLFFYMLIKLLPTVGCEADAATRYGVDKRVAGSSKNSVLALGYHPTGRYVSVWPVDGVGGKRMLELEHCLVNPMNWEERMRVIQVVRLEVGMVSLEKIWVFSEHWYGSFRNGEQLGGCAIKETGFASTNALEVSEIVGEWKGIERFEVARFESEEKDPIYQLVKNNPQNLIRGELGLVTLPKRLWCSLIAKDDGETCAEVGWMVDSGHAITSRSVIHKDGRLKEMAIQEEARGLDDKHK